MNSSEISLTRTFLYFAFFTLMLFIATRHVIPFLNQWGFHPAISWFVSGGLLVFAPMFVIALQNVRKNIPATDKKAIMERLWLTRPSAKDWLWTIAGTILILISTGVILLVAGWISMNYFGKPFQTSPSFMHFEPLLPSQYWILAVWIIFFFFNIFGEEILWRGYLLAGMSERYPGTAWLYNAVFWMMFHIPFGYELMVMVLPTFFLIPYLVQKRKNTWIGIIIHAGLNGPGFILVALGGLDQ
jgi:membrane protease YdiL (CAAX protease family)